MAKKRIVVCGGNGFLGKTYRSNSAFVTNIIQVRGYVKSPSVEAGT